jgi:hypothetical protein
MFESLGNLLRFKILVIFAVDISIISGKSLSLSNQAWYLLESPTGAILI